jgi:hypothetical protein
VAINELVIGVNIALGSAALNACPSYDTNGDGTIEVDELITAVNNAQAGCAAGTTPTPLPPSPTPTNGSTETATPTVTWTPAPGPTITFFGVTLADDSLELPSDTTPDGIPIYTMPFGFGFKLVVEAHGRLSANPSSYTVPGTPDLQIQSTRDLGNGSAAVCDVEPPNFGGIPGIDPPQLEDPGAIADALNDFGCRFIDGTGASNGRSCAEACVKYADGEYHCVSNDTDSQFCAPITMPMRFPDGGTLVSVRVRDLQGQLGSAAQLIIRVAQ